MRSLACLASALAIAWVSAAGCTSDHSRLEQGAQSSSSKASGGAGGTSQGAGGAKGSGGSQTVSATATQSSSASGPIEPVGTTKLTFVNGLVDQDVVRYCFSKYPAGPGAELPWPSGGLPFARGAVVDIPTVVPAGSDVEIRAVLGGAAAVGAKSCSELAAMPAGITVQSLGVAPASVFAEPKSLLFVSYGCTGGPSHTNGLQTLACGQGYTPSSPTSGLIAGFMSRLGGSGMRLQFVDAIVALNNQAQLGLAPGQENAPAQPVVPMFTLGSIAPFPPFDAFTVSKLDPMPKARLEINLFGNPYKVTLDEAFKNSALPIGSVKDGEGLVFIAVGAQPGIGDGPWWHHMTFTVVKSDP